ncbi:S1C family serine protease [Streptomyces sp. NPDC051315]|uniref:S1C family serine protease n=1 Tax=Streptomyces sp. NPDC051315 TaxID=3365650 RepID=UPI0037BAEC3C
MRPTVRMWGAAVSALTLALGVTGTSARADDPDEIFEKVSPATVQVLGNDLSGTGVIYDADNGLIVTNAHVVVGQSALRVRIEDREPVPVRLMGSDPCEDLAVLKLQTPQEDLGEVEFGNSGDLRQGDEVTAIGYPEAAGETSRQKAVLTDGVVQSPDVAQTGEISAPNLPSTVQHSATLNSGNSGGPLLNSESQLVGINTFSLSGTEGQYYSISSDHAEPVVKELADGRSKNNPGWDLVATSDPQFASHFEEEAEARKLQKRLQNNGIDGLYVAYVAGNSPASEADVANGDVITQLKDTVVTTVPEVCGILQSSAAGEKLGVDGVFTTDITFDDGTKVSFGDPWHVDMTLKE